MGERSGAPEFYYISVRRIAASNKQAIKSQQRAPYAAYRSSRVMLGWRITTTNYWVGKCVPGHRRRLTWDPAFDATYYVAVII